MAFSSLLKSRLHLNPSKRITPDQALKHPFITTTRLPNEKKNTYAGEAHLFRFAPCIIQMKHTVIHTETDMELGDERPLNFFYVLDILMQLPLDQLALKTSGRGKSRVCFRPLVESAAERG